MARAERVAPWGDVANHYQRKLYFKSAQKFVLEYLCLEVAQSKKNKFLLGLLYVGIGILIANVASKGLVFSNIPALLGIVLICVIALAAGVYFRK